MADHETIEFITATISNLLKAGGISSQVEYEDSLSKGLLFTIHSPDAHSLIGHQGVVLYALETIIHALVAKHFSGRQAPVYFSIDVDGYKRKREWLLKQIATESVETVKSSGKPLILTAMPKYERKYIHMYIQEQFPEITTESIGNDPNRKIRLSV